MKILINFSFVWIICVCACSDKKDKEHNTDTIDTAFTVLEETLIKELKENVYNARLNYKNIDSFFTLKNIREINASNEFNRNTFTRLTADEYAAVFQDTSDFTYEPEYNGAYYYSKQGEWNGLRRYMFVKLDEECCTYYYYNVYDQSGKKTDAFIFEASGGDAGWHIHVNSRILNDSTIEQTTVECESTLQNNKEVDDCDSTVAIYTLLSSGKFQRNELNHNSIIRK